MLPSQIEEDSAVYQSMSKLRFFLKRRRPERFEVLESGFFRVAREYCSQKLSSMSRFMAVRVASKYRPKTSGVKVLGNGFVNECCFIEEPSVALYRIPCRDCP